MYVYNVCMHACLYVRECMYVCMYVCMCVCVCLVVFSGSVSVHIVNNCQYRFHRIPDTVSFLWNA